MQGELFDDFTSPAQELNDGGYLSSFILKITKISYRQLDHWVRIGLITPSIHNSKKSGEHRIFSFKDIILIKTIMNLRNYGISLQKIKKAFENLDNLTIDELTKTSIFSDGQNIFITEQDNIIDLSNNNTGVLNLEIEPFVTEIVLDSDVREEFRFNSVENEILIDRKMA